ncbi:diacylglycerol kinase family protein [Streptomyces scopuliridis]|uniref:Diacylglycerol kinase family protein n=1 Tax=Streptomyces scopuliridis TaxID=452529 RepID=A0ACD4ZKB6_9ACTN|nr:diacylglycerol kinase [Streptomyces scopuliridis]WSB98742.1 diacylglycerol kinase family protein [Streptomyces scopuliridis]WSC07555.1 diacylglycerol kinase family protein [Streptomyces scopuliridis]
MSAPEPAENGAQQLLVVIDPFARRTDGESVRIAKDVLSAGAAVKFCLPDGPEEFARALARRGSRRPVVVGDDRTLLRTVALLHRERELASGALSLVPIGASVELARSLGVPTGAVAAARAVLDGAARALDLLVDDSDGVVLGDLRIPALPAPRTPGAAPAAGSVWHTCRSLVRTLVRPVPYVFAAHTHHRLRVEADGVLLNDLDEPVEGVRVSSRGGRAEVVIRTHASAEPVRASALSVTVSGADFRYRADTRVTGPVRTRTWTLRPGAWQLTLPAGAGAR